MSDETKRKIGIAKLGMRHTAEAKKKIGIASTGKQYSLGRKRPQCEIDRIKATMKERGVNKREKNGMWGKIGTGAKKVLNTETGEIFYSLKSACNAIGIKYTKGRKHLSGQNKNTTGLIYV